jgi:chemotaxis protein MotB
MSRRKRRPEDEETSYWLSYSDMMAALLLIFILIISFTMLQAKGQYESKEQELAEQQEIISQQEEQLSQQQEELDRVMGIRSDLVEALRDEFEDSDLNVSVDSKTGAITFDASVLFDVGNSELKDEGKEFLESFIPRYCSVLLSSQYKDYVSEIIIEGHTDTNGTYLYNLELSQQRAFSVATFCLTENTGVLSKEEIETLRSVLTANGRSYSNPIYNEDGTVDMSASRRVEFKFRLEDEEMIDEMIQILEEE